MGEGCKTFDGALFDLILAGKLEDAEALRAADSPNNLRIRIERFRNKGMEAEQPTLRLAPQPQKLKPVAPATAPASSRATGSTPPIRN
jgi:hypothetical protein